MHDLKFALRQLVKSPGFTAVAVLSLALGIGANTALFSLVNDLLLRSLPVQRPEELVLFRWVAAQNGLQRSLSGYTNTDAETGLRTSTSLSHFIFERLQAQNDSFTDLFAFCGIGQINTTIDQQAELARAQVVTGGYFSGLGVTAWRGRLIAAEDNRADAPPVVVISHRFWLQRFAGANDAIGQTIRLNTVNATIVGVTPPGFAGTLQVNVTPDLTAPMALEPALRPQNSSLNATTSWWLHIMGRLKPGVSAAQAQARNEPVLVQAAKDAWVSAPADGLSPSVESRDVPRLRLQPGGQGLMEERRNLVAPLRLLTIIVGCVLVIACMNVANLLLVRATARRKEIAVRLSVGASRGRLLRQLLTESVVLALIGGGLGILVAYWGRDALLQLQSIEQGSLALDWPVLAFTIGVSTLTGVLFGVAPAWQATRVDLTTALKSGASAPATGGRFPLRRVLMVVQAALSVVLLVGAGLFIRTLHNLRRVDAGFARENLITFSVDPSQNGYRGAEMVRFHQRLRERLRQLPGAPAVALTRFPLLGGGGNSRRVGPEGLDPAPNQNLGTGVNVVSPDYFATLQVRLRLGRVFTERDDAAAPRVAIVNEAFARAFLRGENPVGRSFSFTEGPNANRRTPPMAIVGLISDVRYLNLRDAVRPAVYLPFEQEPGIGGASILIRARGAATALAPALRTALREIDPNVPLTGLRTQDEQVDRLLANERLFAQLTTFLGVVALVLTCIGLYGLLAHQVATRTREIGIRMALGAQVRAVVALVLREGLGLAALGVVIGLGVAIGVTRFLAKMLFGVQPLDPLTLAGAGLVLVVIAALACWLPARRAAKVDPMTALRAE